MSGRTSPYLALLGLAVTVVSCTSLAGLLPSAGPFSGPLITPNPFATATGTPFGPLARTALPPPTGTATITPPATPTSENPWGNYPGPVEPSAIEIPREMPVIPFSERVVNVVLLGSDARPTGGGHRTDTMMIVSMDPDLGTVTLISIPRDLYVYIPGWRVDRINVADGRGGPDLVREVILYNLGIPVDFWVRMNFGGFRSLIDSLGGVDVEIGRYYAD